MWNLQMLYQCGKLAQVLREFDEIQLDILGVSKMRWTGSGKMHDSGKTILYSGHSEQHICGVGIVLNKEADKNIDWMETCQHANHHRMVQLWHMKTTMA